MKIKYYFLLIFLFAVACNNSSRKASSSTLNLKEIKKKVAIYDALFLKNDPNFLKVYIQKNGNNHFTQLKNFKSFPEDVTETLKMLYNKNGKMIMVEITPTSESGDYFNSVTYYFYNNGKTMAYETYSSFFSDDCTIEGLTDGSVKEIRRQYFDTQFKLLGTTYSFTDDKNKMIDSSKCIFNYRMESKPVKSVKEISELKAI